MDISWHRDFSSLPSLEEYALMCRLKTGALARLAAVLGVYGAVTEPRDAQVLAEILGKGAEQLGAGFQILDDVTNLTQGNPGKKRGDDIVEGKKSLPILLYLHRRRERRSWVAACFSAARIGGTGVPQVEELIGELASEGILEEARNQGRTLIREARSLFAGDGMALPVLPEGDARRLLAGLVDRIS
jgi:octaprenyl-diphosphate synthase